ncbi:restriction endonuclease [Pseudoalteromonas issachenkonii]|uniref:Restriction endonuclease n=1 Tax=Pseudoalteromonas issachenkonii TaxID=152297 RepID=A0ABU9GVE6_9GAMM
MKKKWLDVDFREMPQGNVSNGDQDAFELFARDLLEAIGFKIIKGPARGSDDRKDLIISELREGRLGNTEVKYLVSCKHFAHTKQENKSVGNNQEPDIVGRLKNNGCTGFIGFYSTIASEALQRELKEAQRNNPADLLELQILDKAKIVDFLHNNEKTMALYKRYFPSSFKSNWRYDMKSNLYAYKPEISCLVCGGDILESMEGKIVQLAENEPKYRDGKPDWNNPIPKIKKIVFACDLCAHELLDFIDKKYLTWPFDIMQEDISRYTNPRIFIDRIMQESMFIQCHPNRHTDESFRTWNIFSRAMFYFVSRPMNKLSKNSLAAKFKKYEL